MASCCEASLIVREASANLATLREHLVQVANRRLARSARPSNYSAGQKQQSTSHDLPRVSHPPLLIEVQRFRIFRWYRAGHTVPPTRESPT